MRYQLTRKAVADLRAIHKRSTIEWGEPRADRYLEDLYSAIIRVTEHPERDRSRNRRAFPFQMVPAQKHFLIYEIVDGGTVIVLAALHQAQDIEKRIADLTPSARQAIADIKRKS